MQTRLTILAAIDLLEMPRGDAKRMLSSLDRLASVEAKGRVAEQAQASGVNMTALVGRSGDFRVRSGDWRALM